MHVAILSGSSVCLFLVCNRVVILASFANLFVVQYLYLDLFLDAKLLNIGVPFVVHREIVIAFGWLPSYGSQPAARSFIHRHTRRQLLLLQLVNLFFLSPHACSSSQREPDLVML